jgi:hypothetical protein
MYVCSMYIICTYVSCTYDGVWYGIKGQGMYSQSMDIVGPRYSRSTGIVASQEPSHRLYVVRRPPHTYIGTH